MSQPLFTKFLYSSLFLSCTSLQPLFAMDLPDAPMGENQKKRMFSATGLNPNEPSEKRLRLGTALDFAELPILELIEKSYVDEDCRIYVMDRIYNGFIDTKSLNINFEALLRLGRLKWDIETLSPIELHFICVHNPADILNTDLGKNIINALRSKAETGPYAQETLACLYGVGIPDVLEKNLLMALELYTKAANQELARAQCTLGGMYKNGNGVEKNLSKAFEWCSKAAIQGQVIAQCTLGFMYEYGEGVDKDFNKAFEWYSKAAIQGHVVAQHNLGGMYYLGQGVDKDPYKAFEWYTKAANQGNALAQYNLGGMYQIGLGVDKDFAKALQWYIKAANQGHVSAQGALKTLVCKTNCEFPDKMDVLSATMTIEMGNLLNILECGLGESIFLEQKSNETGSFNTQGNNQGMSIPSLHDSFQCLNNYSQKIIGLLKHLHSQKALDKGFLVTTLKLNPDFQELGILKKQMENSTSYVHMVFDLTDSLSYFSFEDPPNLDCSKLFQYILDEESNEYTELNESLHFLKGLYRKKVSNATLKAMEIQDTHFLTDEDRKSAREQIEVLNKIIAKDRKVLGFLNSFLEIRKKLIEIIKESTPLRNKAFSENQLMKHL